MSSARDTEIAARRNAITAQVSVSYWRKLMRCSNSLLVVMTVTAILFCLAGCSPEPVAPTHVAVNASAAIAPHAIFSDGRSELERDLLELESHMPGFSTIFYDDRGALVVRTTSGTVTDEEWDAVLAFARARSHPTAIDQVAPYKHVERANWRFSELSAFRRTIVMSGLADVIGIALNHYRGTVDVFFDAGESAASAAAKVAKLGLPNSAFRMLPMFPGAFSANQAPGNIRYYTRPLVAGLEVRNVANGGVCTAGGFVRRTESTYPRFMVTAAHCSTAAPPIVSTNPANEWMQPATGQQVGFESFTPLIWSAAGGWTPNNPFCPFDAQRPTCFRADAMLVTMTFPDSVLMQYVALRSTVGAFSFPIIETLNGVVGYLTGTPLDLVGRTNGRQLQTVMYPEGDIVFTKWGSWWLREQVWTRTRQACGDYDPTGPGDSGAPVFTAPTWNPSGPGLVGTHSSEQVILDECPGFSWPVAIRFQFHSNINYILSDLGAGGALTTFPY